MTTIDAVYTVSVKITDLEIESNQSRVDVEKKIKELAQKRISALLTGFMYDPEGKVFTENISITPKQN